MFGEMNGFDAEAKSKGLLFLNECGLDPGLDHMSRHASNRQNKSRAAS